MTCPIRTRGYEGERKGGMGRNDQSVSYIWGFSIVKNTEKAWVEGLSFEEVLFLTKKNKVLRRNHKSYNGPCIDH